MTLLNICGGTHMHMCVCVSVCVSVSVSMSAVCTGVTDSSELPSVCVLGAELGSSERANSLTHQDISLDHAWLLNAAKGL